MLEVTYYAQFMSAHAFFTGSLPLKSQDEFEWTKSALPLRMPRHSLLSLSLSQLALYPTPSVPLFWLFWRYQPMVPHGRWLVVWGNQHVSYSRFENNWRWWWVGVALNTCMNSVKTFKVWSRASMLLTNSSKDAVSLGTGAVMTERGREREAQ